MRASVALAVALMLGAVGCSSSSPTASAPPTPFPRSFLFGTATAGFQSDMGCPTLPKSVCNDPNSDWDAFVTSPQMQADPTTYLSGQDPEVVGPGMWELYQSDFDLAKNQLHNNAARVSIEWSRIFPKSTVGVEGYAALKKIASASAIAHYHAEFQALIDRGMTPLVTIDHYTLPIWIHDGVGCHLDFAHCSPRGWLDHDTIVHEIAKYAGFVAREFGGQVDLWATLNEPFAVLLSGFLYPSAERSNPPAVLLQVNAFKQAFAAMIDAHAAMYDAVKQNDTVDANGDGHDAEVGLVYAMAPVAPADPNNPLDVKAAKNVFYLWNEAFLDAVALGKYSANLDDKPVLRPDLEHRMDFIGINYYVRIIVQGTKSSILPALSPLATFNITSYKTDVYPPGIYDMVKLVNQRYQLPAIITENNGQAITNGDVQGEISTVVQTLEWLQKAVKDGLDVRGYFYWTLTDNYEWNHGMNVKAGLYAVDPNDPQKKRVPRQTVDVYGRIAQAHGVPSDLAKEYPIQ